MPAERGAVLCSRGDCARGRRRRVNWAGGFGELSAGKTSRVIEPPPVQFNYRGAKITTAPLPSSGGLVLAQSLFILDTVNLSGLSATDRVHYAVEAMRRGYHDRARYMGDPDFFAVPVAKLASRKYAQRRGASIDPAHATPSSDLAQAAGAADEAKDTTHFSIIDGQGNRVAATLSVNGPFGSGYV